MTTAGAVEILDDSTEVEIPVDASGSGILAWYPALTSKMKFRWRLSLDSCIIRFALIPGSSLTKSHYVWGGIESSIRQIKRQTIKGPSPFKIDSML